MGLSRSKAQDYAEEILNQPRGRTRVHLRKNKSGYTLLHRGRALTKTHNSAIGAFQAAFMAEALGVELPENNGETVEAFVSSGVLYRAVAISSLDLRKPEPRVLLGRLLGTAALQRGAAFDTLEIE